VRLRPNRDVEWWSGGVVERWSGAKMITFRAAHETDGNHATG
jgi:hypothetical protein